MKIDRVPVLGVIFHPSAGTTPERVRRRAVELHIARSRRLKIGDQSARRILRSQYVVEQGSFVVVGIPGARVLQKEGPGQTQHVVSAASLHGLRGAQVLIKLCNRKEVLA